LSNLEIVMQTKSLIAAVAFAVIGTTPAFAQEATSDAWMAAAATKSRAEVQAELQQARTSGQMRVFRAGYIEPLKASKSRAEIVAETLAARDNGQIEQIDAEAYAFSAQPQQPAVRLAKSAR
jgi:uncharacterized protein YdbL (DUF1318 family)